MMNHRLMSSRRRQAAARIGAPLLVAATLSVLGLFLAGGAGASPPHVPAPELGTFVNPEPRPCALEGSDAYERRFYRIEGWKAPDFTRYPGACERLRFSYPVLVKPGQNDVLIEPVRIEKPMRDGYVTRIEPNLVDINGKVPPTEDVHLHHGTWISVPSYGGGPFFAAGEEKTVAPFPRGYGMPVKGSDIWLLLYMVHSAVQTPMVLWITYDIDFIPKAEGDALGSSPPTRSGSTCGLPPTPCSTPRPPTAERTGAAPGRRSSAPTSTPGATRSSGRASRVTATGVISNCRPKAGASGRSTTSRAAR